MKKIIKKIAIMGIITIIATTVVSAVFAEVTGGTISTDGKSSVETTKDDFNHPYKISNFVKVGDQYIAKAVNNNGSFGYILVTNKGYKCLYRDELSAITKSKADKKFKSGYLNIQITNFGIDQESMRMLEEKYDDKIVNTIPTVINGKDCLFTILNDGSYVVVENGNKVITHCLRHELLKNI